MDSRLKLDAILREYTSNVYFNPPNNIQMKYPAIVYTLADINNDCANNGIYRQQREYEITVIDHKVDSEIVDALSKRICFSFVRPYRKDGLSHTIFTATI